MSAGVVTAYLVSYWTYYQAFLCSEACSPGPRVGIPDFSIELTVFLAGTALVPLAAAFRFGPILRYFAGVSALSVATFALANSALPLTYLLHMGQPGPDYVLAFGPLPWFAPPLVLLLVAAGSVETLSGLGSPDRVGRLTSLAKALGVSVVFVVAVFWPIMDISLASPTPFYLESGIFLALFYAVPAVIILSIAFLNLAPGVPREAPSVA